MTELKPCPFCGSKDLQMHTCSFYVQCKQCCADGPWNDDGEEAAIEDWNARYNPTQMKEQND